MSGLDIDTADTVQSDLENNLVPWLGLAAKLEQIILARQQIGTTPNIPSTVELFGVVVNYIEEYSTVVLQRLAQDRYRTIR